MVPLAVLIGVAAINSAVFDDAGLDALLAGVGGVTAEASSAEGAAALQLLCGAFLAYLSPLPGGDAVARFHLDNGARLERLNPRGDVSAKGLRQSFGMMVNYLYDLSKVEASHAKFRQGEVARSRAITTPG